MSDRWYLRQLYARCPASTLTECSSTNSTTDVLPAWRSTASSQSGRNAVSESQIPKSMDWSWRYTELATMVTGSEPIKARLHGSPRTINTVQSTKVNRVNSSFQRKWSTGLAGEKVGDGQISFNVVYSLRLTHQRLPVSTGGDSSQITRINRRWPTTDYLYQQAVTHHRLPVSTGGDSPQITLSTGGDPPQSTRINRRCLTTDYPYEQAVTHHRLPYQQAVTHHRLPVSTGGDSPQITRIHGRWLTTDYPYQQAVTHHRLPVSGGDSTQITRIHRRWLTTDYPINRRWLTTDYLYQQAVTHHRLPVQTSKSRPVPHCRTSCSSVWFVLLIWLLSFVNCFLNYCVQMEGRPHTAGARFVTQSRMSVECKIGKLQKPG
jgi:hypothetical protein